MNEPTDSATDIDELYHPVAYQQGRLDAFLHYLARGAHPAAHAVETQDSWQIAAKHLEQLRSNMNTYHDYSSGIRDFLKPELIYPRRRDVEHHHHIYAYCAHICEKALAGALMVEAVGTFEEQGFKPYGHGIYKIGQQINLTRQWLDENQYRDERMLEHVGYSDQQIKEFYE